MALTADLPSGIFQNRQEVEINLKEFEFFFVFLLPALFVGFKK
jgi:hypothetical protein